MRTQHTTAGVALLVLALSAASPAAGDAGAASRTLIKNVRVWDGRTDRPSEPTSVLVDGHLIARIGKLRVSEGGDADVIDGGGRILIPGLIDAHQHLSMVAGPSQLRNDLDWMYNGAVSGQEAGRMLLRGFTTVRDLGGPTTGLARAIDEGRLPGPRIYSSAAFISQTSGHADFRNRNDPHPGLTGDLHMMDRQGWVHLADGPAEVLRAVRESLRSGATQIKVMAGGGVASNFDPIESVQYTPEEMQAAVAAAADYDTYVAVHAYTDAAIRRALEAGVKCIDHGMLIAEPTMKMLVAKGAFLSPQAWIFSGNMEMDWFTEENRRKLRQVSAGLDNEMRLAKKHGAKVVFGTDMFGPALLPNQNLEFGARLRWFTSLEILKQATSTAAELLALTNTRNPYREGPLGVVAEGAYADLLVVEGNPLEDIRVLEDPATNLKLIMKDGVVHKNVLP